jgi:hypothetical protein
MCIMLFSAQFAGTSFAQLTNDQTLGDSNRNYEYVNQENEVSSELNEEESIESSDEGAGEEESGVGNAVSGALAGNMMLRTTTEDSGCRQEQLPEIRCRHSLV